MSLLAVRHRPEQDKPQHDQWEPDDEEDRGEDLVAHAPLEAWHIWDERGRAGQGATALEVRRASSARRGTDRDEVGIFVAACRIMDAVLARDRHLARREVIHTLTRRVGAGVGWLFAPVFALTSALRHARTFHPTGDCVDAVAEIDRDVPAKYHDLAERLTGPVFVRFSEALTKQRPRWPDVLGCALRFGRDKSLVEHGDQDLLFATIKRPWTMPFAPFSTHVNDYLGNDYFAVSPFHVTGVGRCWFRLHPKRTWGRARSNRGSIARRRRLVGDVANGTATLVLGVAAGPRGPFQPVVRIHLVALRRTDIPAMRFDPFRAGRGVVPIGFVHGLRRGVYAASQHTRP